MTLRSLISDLYLSGGTANNPGPVIIANGTFTTSSTTVPADTGRGEATDWFTGSLLVPIAGAVAFQPRRIVNFAVTTGVFTLDESLPFTAAPGLVRYVIVLGAYDVVPAADNTDNGTPAHVIGQKGDAAAAGAVTVTDTLVGQIKQLINTLETTVGIPVFPAAAAPANNVSLAEVLRIIFDRTLGDGTNASANLKSGIRVVRSTSNLAQTGVLSLFTIATGQVIVHGIIGTVTTNIEVQGNNTRLDANPTTGATAPMCANLDITGDIVGDMYSITGQVADVLVGTGAVANMCSNPVVVDIGVIEMVCAAGNTGQVQWTLFYTPLEDGATVVTA